MKKILFLLFIIVNFLNSADLLTFKYGYNNYSFCIKSYSILDNKLNFITVDDNSYSLSFSNIDNYAVKNGYIVKNDSCIFADSLTSNHELLSTTDLNIKNLSALGLNNYDLNFLLALSGLISSTLLLYGVIRSIT